MDHRIQVILVTLAAVIILLLLRFARPEFPPLKTSPDDPFMKEARDKARASLAEFSRLYHLHPKNAIIKLRFVSNSNQVEYLWAEVLKEKNEKEYEVRLITPPVTHTGSLDRLYTCNTDDIEDWQVTDEQGKFFGAFTQRAMLK